MTKIIFIVGPTAVGKTEAACFLAKKINAEIISCDSMQIYKGMDILTAKPSIALRKKIPHYLIDEISPSKEYNVAAYRKKALSKIKSIIKKGKTPIFVGGTGLYVNMLVDGIFDVKTEDEDVRKKLYSLADKKGSAYLYDKLRKNDPQAARKIHPNDTRRIVRALEVLEVTGKPITELQKARKGLSAEFDIDIFCLDMDRSALYRRIDSRVDGMFKSGLIKEVKGLLKKRLSKTASCAIGIKEIKGYLDGSYDLDEAKRLVRRNSRWYAKRQLTWFRKDKRIIWIPVKDKQTPQKTAKEIYKTWKEHS
ncbi:tRNA (adenosine(37)-N6)-dimethylallyltransferase MiaA [bacterium]|nr:MAG: tRNA (adenosine(37)-N6)-dimethylallyltransferase MiaA [bacterium]